MIDLRHVRSARFQASGAEAVSRAAILFEDALRTASLPAERLLLVRRLDLGVIRTAAPPSSIALRLEGQVQDWESLAVPADSPGAASAPAVWFESPLEAVVRVATIVARGGALTEWFWPCVLGAISRRSGPDSEDRAIDAATVTLPMLARRAAAMVRAADRSARAAAVLAFWRRLVSAGVAAHWLARMSESDARELLVLAEFPWIAEETAQAFFERVADPEPVREAMSRRAMVPVEWRDLPPMARRWVIAVACAEQKAWLAAEPSRWARYVARALLVAESDSEVRDAHRPSAGSPAPSPRDSRNVEPSGDTGESQPPQADAELLRAAGVFHRVPTEAGGLCFVIPILIRLGFPEWLDEDESRYEAGLPLALLRAILDQCDVAPEDSVRRAVDATPDPRVRPWIRDLRLWLRRNARMRLSTLVRHPALFSGTETHWDFFLPIARADLRVRRLALDIDPGWVPWLGRVISYHYEHGIE